MLSNRWTTAAGIAAPGTFIASWMVAGAQTDGYSPVRDHISDLAAVGAETRPLMTSGLVTFGVLAPVYGAALGRALSSRLVTATVATAGVGSLLVAAFPLGASYGNGPHGAAAAVSYVADALAPLVAARQLTGRARWASVAAGVACGALLGTSLVSEQHGLFQRLGLTTFDVWLAATAVGVLRGKQETGQEHRNG